jgi:tRNA A-37 threonylcarbamoyl transferase component Bud32
MGELIRGRYEPLEVVGRGGQGEVVRARDSLHDRQVALKVRPVRTPAEREAVLSEARVLLDVRPHAGLPLVREDFYVGRRYYLVMDWVEGKSLQQVLDERGDPGLAFDVVVGYLQQVAAALDHLHAHEPPVVHGDVKPANLILTPRGQVVLVDFGVAVNQSAAERIPMGTTGYVAPELASEAPTTPAADIYSLAATAYTLLTGRTPTSDDADASGAGSGSDREVARALRGALSTDPVRRPGSAGELVAGLERAAPDTRPSGILTFLAVESRPPGIAAGAIERHGGVVAGGEGSTVLGVFPRASDAIGCALAVQDGIDDAFVGDLDDGRGGGRASVRMALHTGEFERRQDEYRGGAVERAVAMCALAADGQILVSQVTRQLARDSLLAGVSLDPVGVRPGGTSRSERVFELSRTTGSEPSLDSSGSVTIPFDRSPTAALAPETSAPPPPRPARRRGHGWTRTLTALVAALVVVAGALAWVAGTRDPSTGPGGVGTLRQAVDDTTPSTTAEVVAALPPGSGPLPAGRYRTTTFAPSLSFASDGTWRLLKGEYGDIVDLAQASGPDTSLLTIIRFGRVFDASGTPATAAEIDAAATAAPDDVASWLAAHPRLETTSEPVEVGGYQGVRLTVRVAPGAGYPGVRCPSRCVLRFALDTPGRLFELVEGNQNRLDVVTVDGTTLVVAAEAPPAAFDAFGAAVDTLLATVTA